VHGDYFRLLFAFVNRLRWLWMAVPNQHEESMNRVTTLASVILFAAVGTPLAALAEGNAADQRSDTAGTHSNPQWSETAKKGKEGAAEVKPGAKVEGAKMKTDAKAKADKMKGDAKASADKATRHAKGKTDKAARDAAAKANAPVGDPTAKSKAKVDAAIPGMGADTEVEGGAEK
jgi:hypothetical protein